MEFDVLVLVSWIEFGDECVNERLRVKSSELRGVEFGSQALRLWCKVRFGGNVRVGMEVL